MIDLSGPETAFALEVIQEASAICQRVQGGMAVRGLTKSDLSPVTVADFCVQAYVGRVIADRFPGAVLVAEERSKMLRRPDGAQTLALVAEFLQQSLDDIDPDKVCSWIDHGAADPGSRFWVLDPVDGTKGYLRGGQYAVALALVENGVVTMGALGCPNLDGHCTPAACGSGCLTLARRGEGAWWRSLNTDAAFQALRVSDCADPAQARILRSVESGHTNTGQIESVCARLGVAADPVLMDSQAKYAVLAAGHGEMLFRMLSPKAPDYREKIWDQAAGAIVLEEAGGKITDLHGKPLDFSRGRTLAANTGVFASNGHLHAAGLDAIASVLT